MSVVLIADRGRSLVPAAQTVLEREDLSIIPAPTGATVLEALRAEKPKLLIVGPDLPDVTVADLCRLIRKDTEIRNLSIVLVASPVERERTEGIRKAGCNDVLYRPLEAAEFDRKIAALLAVRARKELRVLVQIKIEQSREGFFSLAHTRNLSTSGALLESDQPLEIGSHLTVRFFLPGRASEIAGHCEVVRERTGSYGVRLFGIRFHGMSEDDKIAIGDFVSKRSVAELVRQRKAAAETDSSSSKGSA